MADPRYRFDPVVYQAVTPVHVGAGQDVGLVDLPVVRERTTDHPYLPGSGIRGALRDSCEAADPTPGHALVQRLFGGDEGDEIRSGCLAVLDAHLVLFPVRSHPGLFHWLTCRFAVERFRRLYADLTGEAPGLTAPAAEPDAGTFLGAAGPASLYLEEYELHRAGGEWSWNLALDGVDPARVVLVSDADFLHFVRYATVVRQRNRLSTAKTVLHGQFFSVEMVPAESWFAGFLGSTAERRPVGEDGEDGAAKGGDDDGGGEEAPLDKHTAAAELRRLLTGTTGGAESFVTLGGDESVGLGITRLRWLAAAAGGGEEGGDAAA